MVWSDLPKPYVGAHLGIYDPHPDKTKDPHSVWLQQANNPPALFSQINYDAVDVLHVGAVMAHPDGHFGIAPWEFDKPLETSLDQRFEHVVKEARWKNPNIRIVVEQMYSTHEAFDNLEKSNAKDTAAMVEIYTDSVRDFMQRWQNKADIPYRGKTVSLRIDGYDIDHEGETSRRCTKDVLHMLREKLDNLTKNDTHNPKRKFYVGLTPCRTHPDIAHLDTSMAKSCDFINAQRYSGGAGTVPEDYLHAIPGLDAGQIAIGLETENPDFNAVTNNTIDQIEKVPWLEVEDKNGVKKKVGGVWTWRLGSKWEFQNLFQVWLYNVVHKTNLKVHWNGQDIVPHKDLVKHEWVHRKGSS